MDTYSTTTASGPVEGPPEDMPVEGVIAIGCIYGLIITVLVIILIFVVRRRKREKPNQDYELEDQANRRSLPVGRPKDTNTRQCMQENIANSAGQGASMLGDRNQGVAASDVSPRWTDDQQGFSQKLQNTEFRNQDMNTPMYHGQGLDQGLPQVSFSDHHSIAQSVTPRPYEGAAFNIAPSESSDINKFIDDSRLQSTGDHLVVLPDPSPYSQSTESYGPPLSQSTESYGAPYSKNNNNYDPSCHNLEDQRYRHGYRDTHVEPQASAQSPGAYNSQVSTPEPSKPNKIVYEVVV